MTRLHTIRELAETANCHPMTLYRAVVRGDLEAVRLGHGIRITEEAFQRFLRPVRDNTPSLDMDAVVEDILGVKLGPRR